MRLFWREYNARLAEFHKTMASIYCESNMAPQQTEQIIDAVIRVLMNDLTAMRAKHGHKELPKHIFRKVIIS
jgi:uncharacterized protein (DUF2267 family)